MSECEWKWDNVCTVVRLGKHVLHPEQWRWVVSSLSVSPTLVQPLRPKLDTRAVRPRAGSCERARPDIIHSIGTQSLQQHTRPWSGHHNFRGVPSTVYIFIQYRVLRDFPVLFKKRDWFPCQSERVGRGLIRVHIFRVSTWGVLWGSHLLFRLLPVAHFVSDRKFEHIVCSLVDVVGCVAVLLGGKLHHREGEDVYTAKGEAVPEERGGWVCGGVPLKESSTWTSGTHQQFGLLRH